MAAVRTFELEDLVADEVVALKAGRTVSVCIPCRNEASTIERLVDVIRSELMTTTGIVDELIVLDDRSTDDTARLAAHAGSDVDGTILCSPLRHRAAGWCRDRCP